MMLRERRSLPLWHVCMYVSMYVCIMWSFGWWAVVGNLMPRGGAVL